jgi:hypothetical protein
LAKLSMAAWSAEGSIGLSASPDEAATLLVAQTTQTTMAQIRLIIVSLPGRQTEVQRRMAMSLPIIW